MSRIGNDWDEVLEKEFNKEYYQMLQDFLAAERLLYVIYPPKEEVFKALKLTSYEEVKVVILGQDPYHEKGQANGLAFSVNEGVKRPPSLNNIFKELREDLEFEMPKKNSLEDWAKHGILLLNTVLTTREGMANAHQGKGWERFTDEIIKLLNEKQGPIVFILWGANARKKKPLLTNEKHLVLESPHPSPLSAYGGFFGSKPFSKTKEFLLKNNVNIDWRIKG